MTDTDEKAGQPLGIERSPDGDKDAFAGISKALFTDAPEAGADDTPELETPTAAATGTPEGNEPDPGDEADDGDAGKGERLGIRALTEEQHAALLRAKIPIPEDASDEYLIRLAESAQELVAARDRAFDAGRAQAKPSAEASAKGEGAKGTPDRLPVPDLAPVDLKRAADPVLKALGLDDDEGAPVAAFGQKIYEAAVRATTESLRPLIEQAQQAAMVANQQYARSLLDEAREGLREEYPQLADPKRRAEVDRVVQKLAPAFDDEPNLRQAARDLMRAATFRVFGPPKLDAEGKAPAKNGQPSKPGGGRKRAAPRTDAQKDAAAFDSAMKAAGVTLR